MTTTPPPSDRHLTVAWTNASRTARRRLTDPRHGELADDPPKRLPADVAAAWREVRRSAIPGMLWQSDGVLVEITARLIAEMRRDFAGFSAARMNVLRACLSGLGASPRGRQGLKIAPWAIKPTATQQPASSAAASYFTPTRGLHDDE
jgi:hypothetical protein